MDLSSHRIETSITDLNGICALIHFFFFLCLCFFVGQQSLTDVAKFGDGEGAEALGEMIECACSGIMACSTCHVVVHPDWFEKVGHPEEAELDMIDLAYNAQETSRLGCQVILKPNLQNAIFKIPRGANNMMDFIPFEDDF